MTNETDVSTPSDDGIEIETNDPQYVAPAKVEPVAVDEDDDAESPNDETDAEETPERKKNRRARQIERLRNESQAKDRQIAELMARIPKIETPVQPPAKTDSEPQLSEFTDVLDYFQARNDWKISQALKSYAETQETQAKTQENDKVRQEKISKYNQALQPIFEEIPDFADRIQELMDVGLVTANVENAVLDCESPELVSLYLVANPQELQAMQGMDEKQFYQAMGRIEAKVGKLSQFDNQQGKRTNAAAPINPVGKKSATSTKSPDEMSQSEYEAYAAKLTARK